MHKRILLTVPVVMMIGFSLFALNVGIKRSLVKSAKNKKVKTEMDTLRDGDIIFQTNVSGQGKAIQLATKSKYTHVGILMKQDGAWYVYEAVQPVSKTPLEVFIEEGDSGKYIIKCLSGSDTLLRMDEMARMKTYLTSQLGKDYDPYFNWTDSALYCSELVWKAYRKIGVEICELRRLKSFHLESKLVKQTMRERYGDKVPYEEKVVSPGDIFESSRLITVSGK